MANTKPLCCGRKYPKNFQSTTKVIRTLQSYCKEDWKETSYPEYIKRLLTHVTQVCVRKITEEEKPAKSNKTWYLPPPSIISPSEGRGN